MSAGDLRWYVRRATRMSPAETAVRVRDQVRQQVWRSRQVHAGEPAAPVDTVRVRRFPTVLDPAAREGVDPAARAALIADADRLLAGEWDVLGANRSDLRDPDWFHDPATGRRAPHDQYAFRIRYRSEAETGNVKQIWEISRHQHLTVLAAAWYLTGDDRYADAVAAQLRSWWRQNPFLSGVHWTSGIEIALRLIAWVWIRRLLDEWPGVAALFDDNDDALRQISWHQEYLAAFRSVGSSANNHLIAEAAGQLIASCALPWFAPSAQWRRDAADLLARSADANTFASGVNRELATDYHVFVAELLLLAALESERAGLPVAAAAWTVITRTLDAAAALLDTAGQPPRQGDGDDGRALLLDGPGAARWPGLLDLGARVVGPLGWWPGASPTVLSALVGSMATHGPVAHLRVRSRRPATRPAQFADAGITLLRTPASDTRPEIWCRVDGGSHGFLSTAAHAHADALSIEVRHHGVDILCDPGTYCYHGEEEWRSYFRSTFAHNTIELAGRDQSQSGGPFMWTRHATTRVLDVVENDAGEIESWTAEHDGYAHLEPAATHRRTVRLDRVARRLDIVDEIDTAGTHDVRIAFHIGRGVKIEPGRAGAASFDLWWCAGGGVASATLQLPDALTWTTACGATDPIAGWQSPGFGVKHPTTTVVGSATTGVATRRLTSALVFRD